MFYTYDQNNSGGNFVIDENVDHYVIIEAESADEANEKATDIGLYFNGVEEGVDCECCGDRWNEQWENGDPVPMIYGTNILDEPNKHDGWIIYFQNGSVQHSARKGNW